MAFKVWGFQLELQNLLFQHHEDDGVDDDGGADDVVGDSGVKSFKPKAKF